jgi:hypothetical protein
VVKPADLAPERISLIDFFVEEAAEESPVLVVPVILLSI